MNCKTLFRGYLSKEKLANSSVFVRRSICAALWDYSDRFGLTDRQAIDVLSLWKDPSSLYRLLCTLRVNQVTVIEQYPKSTIFDLYDSNVVVRFSVDIFTNTYVSK